MVKKINMTHSVNWSQIKWFNGKESGWGDISRIAVSLIHHLNDLAEMIGKSVIINRALGRFEGEKEAYHKYGMGADISIPGLSLLDQYLAAEKLNFNGLGLYKTGTWFSPGLHVDIRPYPTRFVCEIQKGKLIYLPLNRKSIIDLLGSG